MAVDLLPDTQEQLLLPLSALLSLADSGVSGGAYAMRDIKSDVLHRLKMSDPKTWPPILVTHCSRGYIVIDGRHRWQCAQDRGEPHIRATCKPFPDDNAIVEAAFEANLTHGYASDKETRSKFVYYLHITYPDMTQAQIAQRAGVSQPLVSRVLAESDEQVKEAAILAGLSEDERTQLQQRKQVEKLGQSFTKTTLKLLEAADQLDDTDLLAVIYASAQTPEARAKLARIGRLLIGSRPGAGLLTRYTGPMKAVSLKPFQMQSPAPQPYPSTDDPSLA